MMGVLCYKYFAALPLMHRTVIFVAKMHLGEKQGAAHRDICSQNAPGRKARCSAPKYFY